VVQEDEQWQQTLAREKSEAAKERIQNVQLADISCGSSTNESPVLMLAARAIPEAP
jgi:hypothetical protein